MQAEYSASLNFKLNKQVNWKSEKIAKHYIQVKLPSKEQIANKIN